MVEHELAEIRWEEADFLLFARGEADHLLDLDVGFSRPADGGAQNPPDSVGREVPHGGEDREPRRVRPRQWQVGVDGGGGDSDGSRHPQRDGFEDPGVAVRDEGITVAGILVGALIPEVVPVDPVEPAVGQLDAIDVLQRPLWSHLDGERIGLPRPNPRRRVDVVVDVHPDDLLGVGDEVAVEPDLGAIVDAGKVQLIRAVAGGGVERRAVPPVLLPEVLGHLLQKVLAVVQVRVGPVVLERLKNRGGHATDVVPVRSPVALA